MGTDIDGDCPFCGSQLEDIDDLFRQCIYTREVWIKLSGICLSLINIYIHFFDWIKWLWKYRKVYNRLFQFPCEKFSL